MYLSQRTFQKGGRVTSDKDAEAHGGGAALAVKAGAWIWSWASGSVHSSLGEELGERREVWLGQGQLVSGAAGCGPEREQAGHKITLKPEQGREAPGGVTETCSSTGPTPGGPTRALGPEPSCSQRRFFQENGRQGSALKPTLPGGAGVSSRELRWAPSTPRSWPPNLAPHSSQGRMGMADRKRLPQTSPS